MPVIGGAFSRGHQLPQIRKLEWFLRLSAAQQRAQDKQFL
jgi:hypothetical protein